MSEPFSLSRAHCAALGPSLFEDVRGHTGTDDEASGIMRSIDRFGGDESILRYEMTPKAQGRGHRSLGAVTWTVRAVRQED